MVDNVGVQHLFQPAMAGWAKVAVNRPIDHGGSGLTYALPPDLAHLPIGSAVRVPLGRGQADGWLTTPCQSEPPEIEENDLKWILDIRSQADLPKDLITLGCWMASYYMAPPGPTISSMLPSPVRQGTGRVEKRFLELSPHATPPQSMGPAQRRLYDYLLAQPPERLPLEERTLLAEADVRTRGPLKALVDQGLLLEQRRSFIESAWHTTPLQTAPPPVPTKAQQHIIDDIGNQSNSFSVHLLHGVTGSGKTEVYLRLIERTLQAGRTALVLVPEIALTPQIGSRLSARFPNEQVAILHSAMPAAARNAGWHAARNGEAKIVLGARSAVFAPLPTERIGLIVVDEEHDASFKQDSTPRYHGRDVAIRRAQEADCPILLCSATPSLESWTNAHQRDAWHLHTLSDRAPGLHVPRVRIINMREERSGDGGHLGPTLRHAIDNTLAQGHQTLLLLNRRGWATHIACSSPRCGWIARCEHCDTTMVLHRAKQIPVGGFIRCHHCTTEVRLPRQCPDCQRGIARLGAGTQRLEEELTQLHSELIPGETMARMDADTCRQASDYHRILSDFEQGSIRVLLGTQMIAKGLDVPGVRLVGVVDADTALHLPDFRASERTFQLIAQVTGRCGRGQDSGVAIIQTLDPDAPSIVHAAEGRLASFLNAEATQRTSAGLPPHTRMCRVIAMQANLTECESMAQRIAEGMTHLAPPQAAILGPMPCPLARLRGRHRIETLLTAASASDLQHWIHQGMKERVLSGSDIIIDVDPISLM